MSTGYIRISRALFDHPSYISAPPAYCKVLTILINRACFTDWVHNDHGVDIALKPGQICCTIRELAAWAKVPQTTVVRATRRFLKDKILQQEVEHTKCVFTISREYLLQDSGTTLGTKAEQDRNTKEESKKEKKEIIIEKGALSAFVEKEPKVAVLPAPCLPPIPNGMKELEERDIQVMFFSERVKGHGWAIPEESMKLWLKSYDIHYLIQTLEVVVTRKNVEDPVRLLAAAIRDDYIGEKLRKKENKAWIEGLKAKHKWPWVKITKAYVTIMTGSNESYYYEWVNFRMEITRILETYGERTA